MKIPGVPYRPGYTSDEVVFGVAVAVALHLLAAGPFILKAVLPHGPEEDEKPLVARPVVQATMLKLGKPIDPKKLPDRVVPQQRTAPKKQLVASREDPAKKPDAGALPPPPVETKDSDIANLINKSDPFAEDAGKVRPEVGRAEGVDGGTETDPNKVQAGDAYNAQLGLFLQQRLTIPSVITPSEERKLCALFQININPKMFVWHVRQTPVKSSGNELFDDAARTMLMKLLDEKAPLPPPPKDVEEQYRGRTVQVAVTGNHGDASRCR